MDISLTHVNFKVQWRTIFIIVGLFIALTACESSVNSNEDTEEEISEESQIPYLKVVNQNTDSYPITGVRLVNYEFNNLEIDVGDSQKFTLDDGMPGGYSDINIIVNYRRAGRSFSLNIEKNFNDGDTTTVRMKGCISAEGCAGVYLE
ncbi:hypothetical protein [Rhodohalobacter barkolensis]|uniref:Uncharacterized protein n=1 Tax=Rhodohalobacter barkolensis TaxID=2053187 RepID=A0A2N0VHV6_9BACT|nr:hypothetical protein [Rhodohalobacter barkolensis]PKD43767.1 hypothetical protein CWD77_09415 [Rhodohalobacter barkolensis]